MICDLPTANGFMGVLGRSSKARCVDSQIAHESPPGTGLVLGTPQSNTRCDLIKRGVLASLPPLPRKALGCPSSQQGVVSKS